MSLMKSKSEKVAFSVLLYILVTITSLVGSEELRTCGSVDKLAVYSVQFKTFWIREIFHKHFPEWRPNAQWSKVVGFSHSPSYKLFRLGEHATEGVRLFSETGETTGLDVELGDEQILDGFSAAPILEGVGESSAKIFVDSSHTLISVISKIVPSPDWFVGLDSLDLCKDGKFIDSITIEVDPMDAGTDNGFTFTSPNWPTDPQGIIFRITNTYPSHPAGSFFYPELNELPTIAAFTLTKEKEYFLSDNTPTTPASYSSLSTNAYKSERFAYELLDDTTTTEATDTEYYKDSEEELVFVPKEIEEVEEEQPQTITTTTMTNEISEEESSIEEEPKDLLEVSAKVSKLMKAKPRGRRNFGRQKSFRRGGYHASSSPMDFLKKRYRSALLEEAQDKISKSSASHSYYENLLSHLKHRRKHLSESLAKKLKRLKKKLRRQHQHSTSNKSKSRDCVVSDWSEWSSCSKSCNIGEKTRTRTILKEAKKGGKSCPRVLSEIEWCGSARNCNNKYFDW